MTTWLQQSPHVGIGSTLQKKFDHLLVTGTGTVEECSPALDVFHLKLCTLLQENRVWLCPKSPENVIWVGAWEASTRPSAQGIVSHYTHTYAHCGLQHLISCQGNQGAPGFFLGPFIAHLEQKVGDAFVATAGGQHQWSLSFWGWHIHTHTCLKQQVNNGIVSNVGGIHQRGPATTILLIQI